MDTYLIPHSCCVGCVWEECGSCHRNRDRVAVAHRDHSVLWPLDSPSVIPGWMASDNRILRWSVHGTLFFIHVLS